MINLIEFIIFTIFTIVVLIHSISYAIYEIKETNNKVGGIFVICFSVITCISSNVVLILD